MGQNSENNDAKRKQFLANAAIWNGSIQRMTDETGIPYDICRRWIKEGVAYVTEKHEGHLKSFVEALGWGAPSEMWKKSPLQKDKYQILVNLMSYMEKAGTVCDEETEEELRFMLMIRKPANELLDYVDRRIRYRGRLPIDDIDERLPQQVSQLIEERSAKRLGKSKPVTQTTYSTSSPEDGD